MTRSARGCLIAAVGALALACALAALFAPAALREARKLYEPIAEMQEAERELEAMAERHPWKPPARPALTAEQLDRFFAARRALDAVYRDADLDLDALERGPAGVQEVGEVVRGVGDLVARQLKALTDARISQAEYHYVERIVYRRWRPALRRAGTHPATLALAAAELEAAARSEPQPRVARRLRALAAGLRARRPPAPEGVPEEVHALLLPRAEEVERWSLDEHGGSSHDLR